MRSGTKITRGEYHRHGISGADPGQLPVDIRCGSNARLRRGGFSPARNAYAEPTRQPGASGFDFGKGGCGAEFPRNMATVAALPSCPSRKN